MTDLKKLWAGRMFISSWMMESYLLHMSLLLILCLSVPTVSGVSHTHFFFTTVTNDSPYDYPSYYMTRSIDDITLFWYDNNNEVIERRVPWFSSANSTLLDMSIGQFRFQRILQGLFQEFTDYLNDTEGFHMLQLLDGCVLYDNGTFDTLFSFHYDGEPFLSFNVKKGNWTAEDPNAQYFTESSNMNKSETEEIRNILVNKCVPHISKLLSLGNCTLNRREPPVVVVTQTPISNSVYRLNCRAYGHYPKSIFMTWYKNGEQVPEELMERVTLPLPDITYLTWLTVNIIPEDDDVYTCSVTHSSMTTPLMTRLSGDSSNSDYNVGGSGISNGGIIGICLAVIVLVLFIAFGSVKWAKSRRW